jgi:hypothetical protein
MNCQKFETILIDLARDQMIEASLREQALAHKNECEACASRLDLEQQLTIGLRALADEMKPASAPVRVEQHLLEAFREQKSLLPIASASGRGRYWLIAAAAAVLIAFGIVTVRWTLDRPSEITALDPTGLEGEGVATASPIEVVQPTSEPRPKQTMDVTPPRRKHSTRKSTKSASNRSEIVAKGLTGGTNANDIGNAEQGEVTTAFMPLSYVSLVNLQEGGQLVRVELPRTAMARLGLPVNMERYGEKVKADVLVSADGLARAIRFVQ